MTRKARIAALERRLRLPKGYLDTRFVTDADLTRMEQGLKTKKKAAPKKRKPAVKKSKRNRRNPDEGVTAAAELSELFHGRPAKEIREYVETLAERKVLTHLGRLVELRVWLDEDDYRALGPFKGVDVAVSPDGGSIYFIAGDQAVNLKALGLDRSLPKDHVRIGECDYLAYHTKKKFDDFEPVTYEHELASP